MRSNNPTQPSFLYLAGFFLIAVNLRAALTCVGPLLDEIASATFISNTAAGALNSLPLAMFALCSPLARLDKRFGLEKMLLYALLILAGGTLLRSLGGAPLLFGGTMVLAAGIAVINVLMPSLIKRDFPLHIGNITTAYSVSFCFVAALASGVAVPLARLLPGGWRGALAVWAVPAMVAVAVWWPTARKSALPALATAPAKRAKSLWKYALAWQITGFMGLQSLNFYVSIGWFPAYLQAQGVSPESSGWLMTLYQICSVAAGFSLPFLVRKTRDQRALATIVSLMLALSALGLLLAPNWAALWLIIMGSGSGPCLLLSLMFIGMRAADHERAAALSVLAQSFGYVIAALGPFAFGAARELAGNWTIPFTGLAALALLQAALGYKAGRNTTI